MTTPNPSTSTEIRARYVARLEAPFKAQKKESDASIEKKNVFELKVFAKSQAAKLRLSKTLEDETVEFIYHVSQIYLPLKQRHKPTDSNGPDFDAEARFRRRLRHFVDAFVSVNPLDHDAVVTREQALLRSHLWAKHPASAWRLEQLIMQWKHERAQSNSQVESADTQMEQRHDVEQSVPEDVPLNAEQPVLEDVALEHGKALGGAGLRDARKPTLERPRSPKGAPPAAEASVWVQLFKKVAGSTGKQVYNAAATLVQSLGQLRTQPASSDDHGDLSEGWEDAEVDEDMQDIIASSKERSAVAKSDLHDKDDWDFVEGRK